MTLGPVSTPLAQGLFDPLQDKVTLNDGAVLEHYYRDRLGVMFYRPIDKTVFPLPPSGWCSWYYYYSRVTAEEVKLNARWIAENLKDYGAKYVQIDDGWQVPPRDWTDHHKERFPQGLKEVADYIKSLGLVPGIWLAPHGHSNEAFVKANPGVFLLRPDGTSASRTWEGDFLVDPTTPQAHAYLKQLFERLCQWGYDYFKIDGQPIVVNEYRTKREFMKESSETAEDLYRGTIQTIRQAIGQDRYLLGCWGIPLEGVGLMNGSRTGGDIVLGWGGFTVAVRAVMAHTYLHNIVWYADPDVMLLRSPLSIEQARAWATLQGLTGQALMASDRLVDLGPERVEILRRVYPATDIRPLDLFPSDRQKRIWDLKVSHLGRTYDVVGVFNFDQDKARQIYLCWQDLGLPGERPIHIFDFWNREYLGAWEGGIAVDVGPASCRVLTLLQSSGKVQLISTSRHITQGAVDLLRAGYDEPNRAYSGTSRVIKGDPYEIRFVFPRGQNMAVRAARASLGDRPVVVVAQNHQGWATVTINSDSTGQVDWRVEFEDRWAYRYPPDAPSTLTVRPLGLDCVELSWSEVYWLNAGYRVYLDGRLQGYTPRAAFRITGIEPRATHTAAVETVWEDGSASSRQAQISFCIAQMLPSSIPLVQLEGQWTGRGARRGPAGQGPMEVGDRVYQDLVAMGPGSQVRYRIDGLFTRLSVGVGVVGTSDDQASVQFRVLGDGRQIWQSQPMTRADGTKSVELDVPDVQQLTLEVTGPSSGRRRGPTGVWFNGVLTR